MIQCNRRNDRYLRSYYICSIISTSQSYLDWGKITLLLLVIQESCGRQILNFKQENYLKESQVQFVLILNLVQLHNGLCKILVLNIGLIHFNSLNKIKDMRRGVHASLISCLFKHRSDLYRSWAFSVRSRYVYWPKWFIRMVQNLHQFWKHYCISSYWTAWLAWRPQYL